ncbi:MAG TPA: hypothetical protein ENJ45_01570, partial [Phaeodactylibacter sp.]|nr:hypothetical protein [Phaeodactylibacter sp.]
MGGYSQNRKALERKRKQLLLDIKKADRLLRATTRSKEANLNKLRTLQNQIRKREQLIRTLQKELAFAHNSILRTSRVVSALQQDLENLEIEYSEIARRAYRQKLTGSKWLFLFSSDGLNQAFKRWQYLRQYEDFRQKQADLMVATKETLRLKIDQLEIQKAAKEQLIATTKKQKEILQRQKNDKNQIVRALQKDEKKLRQDLARKKQSHEKLNHAIEKVIQKEMLAARKKDRSPSPPASSSNTQNNTHSDSHKKSAIDTRKLSVAFQNNKGRLPWPVKDGFITGRFGKQPHPTLKGIQINNNGIDIQTTPGAKVYALFEGKVAGVQYIPGNHYMVIIKHGNYYT